MHLDILTPEQNLYSGEVYGVQLAGVEGLFEILENHAPMVAALAPGKMKIKMDQQETQIQEYEIEGGFVETSNNKTTVLLEGAKAIHA